MSDDFYDDDDNPNESNLVKDLRRQLKAANKKAEEAANEATALRGSVRAKAVSEVLRDKGVRPSIAKYIPDDVTDDAGVTAWLTENAEDFGITLGSAAEDEDLAAARQVQSATSTGGASVARTHSDLQAIENSGDVESLTAAIYAAKASRGPQN